MNYLDAHRGKMRRGNSLRIVEVVRRRLPSKGWAEMIRKVFEVDPLVCPKCGGRTTAPVQRQRSAVRCMLLLAGAFR